MARLLGGSASPIGWVTAYLQADLDAAVSAVAHGKVRRRVDGSAVPGYPECLALLEPLTMPATRELLIAGRGGWTAVVSNHALGGDPSAPAPYMARDLNVRCVTAAHSPRYGPGHGGTQFWVQGPDGEPPLMMERTIDAVAEDGRWRWYSWGQALPFEDVTRYEARRVKDRLDRELLVAYLYELGIAVDDDAFYGEAVAIDSEGFRAGVTRSKAEALAWLEVKS